MIIWKQIVPLNVDGVLYLENGKKAVLNWNEIEMEILRKEMLPIKLMYSNVCYG